MDFDCPITRGDSTSPEVNGHSAPPPAADTALQSATFTPLPAPEVQAPAARERPSRSELRRLVESTVLLLSMILLLRAIAVEPYGVPTGSMAPTLVGNHKEVSCPRCSYPVLVGHRGESGDTLASWRCYANASCPNCGNGELHLEHVVECAGDRLMVDKNVFELRAPQRWEMTVFRCPADLSKPFVKRVVGLPGESIQVRNGDIYIDRFLARKTLEEFRVLRIPVFDNNYQPPGGGWKKRWLRVPPGGSSPLDGTVLRLDGSDDGDFRWLVYSHWQIDRNEETAIVDLSGYNGSEGERRMDPVHDFMVEFDVEVVHGAGWLALSLTDGGTEMTAELSTQQIGQGSRLADAQGPIRTAPTYHLPKRQSFHVEYALVDRRVTLAIDGKTVFEPLDLEPLDWRSEVRRPVKIGVRDIGVVVQNLRIYRDIHYTDAGTHGVRSPYRLGAHEYFVLGDNSANSDDSRFWTTPAVPYANFLGKPFLVHMPSRFVRWDGLGRRWEHQGPDWDRIRWLH